MWWIIIPVILSTLVAIGLNLKLPKIYRASTLILIQRQKVPSDYVREIVSTDLEDRIRTITQQITSWTNLEKIIKKFNLYNDPEKPMFMEDKIENLRERISVDVSKASRHETTSFEIFFTGKNPKQIAEIANVLASYFIDENLKLREDQAISTSEFLTDELATIRKRLIEKEEDLKRYRKKYMGGLPEQLETNLRIAERIQEQIINNQEGLREAQNRILSLQQQIAEAKELKKRLLIPAETGEGADQPTTLDALRSQLVSLEARYTQRHPNVIRLKEKISELEAKEREALEGKKPGKDSKISNTSNEENKLLKQLRETNLEIKNLKGEATKLLKQMKTYQIRIENTPKREQELMSLKRDYSNIRETYNSLLARKLEAELAVNMEKKQKGEQFRILDKAKVPIRPFKPDIRRIFLLNIGLGFAIGFALAYFRETLDTSFRKPEEIEEVLQIPVLANLPFSYSARELRKNKRGKIIVIIALFFTAIILAGLSIVSIQGIDKTLAFIKDLLLRILG